MPWSLVAAPIKAPFLKATPTKDAAKRAPRLRSNEIFIVNSEQMEWKLAIEVARHRGQKGGRKMDHRHGEKAGCARRANGNRPVHKITND